MNHPIMLWIEAAFIQFDIGQLFLSWQLRGLFLLIAGLIMLRVLSASAASRHLIVSAIFSALLLLPVFAFFGPVITVEIPGDISSLLVISENAGQPLSFLSATHLKILFYVVYLVGLAILLFRLFSANLAMWWIDHHSITCNDMEWSDQLDHARETMSVSKHVELRYSNCVKSPLAWGVIKPVIFLPVSAAHWPAPLIKSTLLHELAHISRNDWLSYQVIQIACALYWINPLSWVIAQQLHTDAETACDDKVLDSGIATTRYAEDLVYVARHMNSLMNSATVAMSMDRKPSQLHNRIHTILSFSALVDLSAAEARILAAIILGVLLPLTSIRTEIIELPVYQRVAVPFIELPEENNTNRQDNDGEKHSSDGQLDDVLIEEENFFDHQAFKKIAIGNSRQVLQSETYIAEAFYQTTTPHEKLSSIIELPENPSIAAWASRNSVTSSVNDPQEMPESSTEENATERFANRKIVKPVYPRNALKRGIQGEVVVTFLIDQQGKVINPQVISANPEGVFDKNVLRAVRQFEFDPSTLSSDTGSNQAQEIFRFVLES